MELRTPVVLAAATAAITLSATPAHAADMPARTLIAPASAPASTRYPALPGPRHRAPVASWAGRDGSGGTGPASTIALTVADNGRRVRVHRGDHILVHLAVDPSRYPDPASWWGAVAESGRALRARPQTMMPVRGATLGHYRAVARGQATLSSTRPACPPQPSGPTCHALLAWSVTVDVR